MERRSMSEALHVFVLDDGGETWWYAAPTSQRARAIHVELNYTNTGVDLLESDITDCGVLADFDSLTICDTDEGPRVTKTARKWCDDGGEGFLSTTCL